MPKSLSTGHVVTHGREGMVFWSLLALSHQTRQPQHEYQQTGNYQHFSRDFIQLHYPFLLFFQ